MTRKRIGWACKWLNTSAESQDKKIRAEERTLNTSATTVAWLNRQRRTEAEDRLWQVAKHNVKSVKNVLDKVAELDPRLHMMRLSSDLLPVYTEPTWRYFWQQPDVRDWCEREFGEIGELARLHGIRLSFHPGQFCVLASESDDVVRRSIEEFEYHASMARWMGYGQSWHDHGFKINVHISGRRGPQGIIDVLSRLTPEARNLLTIENDEMSWGLDDGLVLSKHCALVLDIHHHLLHSNGEYIETSDDRWAKIVDSWRGVRPAIHYSIARQDVLPDHGCDERPDVGRLIGSGIVKKMSLRAHCDDVWNSACNEWALSFWPDADIMTETKWKNLSAAKLLAQFDAPINSSVIRGTQNATGACA